MHNVPLHPEVICFEICFSVHRVHWMPDTTEVERSLALRTCSSDAVVHTNRRVSLLLVAYRTLEVIDPELFRIRVFVDEDAVMTETAIRSKMDCIITRNKKDYTKAEIPIYDPIEFWNLLKNDDVNDIY